LDSSLALTGICTDTANELTHVNGICISISNNASGKPAYGSLNEG
jgi:hypothetical protein